MNNWRIDKEGSFCNEKPISNLHLAELDLHFNKPITVRFEVEETAKNRRGLNLFGADFSNYAQGPLEAKNTEKHFLL
jgi:predicted transcriptional regulator